MIDGMTTSLSFFPRKFPSPGFTQVSQLSNNDLAINSAERNNFEFDSQSLTKTIQPPTPFPLKK
jgi:hypothetical protein